MNEAQIKHIVERFLGWRLPENFNPDGGITFKPTFNEHTAHPMKHESTGTNLLDATQAETMVRYIIEGLPRTPSSVAPTESADEVIRKLVDDGLIQPYICSRCDATFGASQPNFCPNCGIKFGDDAATVAPEKRQYYATGYTREDLQAMHPNIKLKPEPEWRKCPQCGRENSVQTWEKFGGKCPSCGDLYDKEVGTSGVAPTETQTLVITKEIAASLLAARDAIIHGKGEHEIYHWLYQAADRGRISYTPWDEWEAIAGAASSLPTAPETSAGDRKDTK